MFDNNDADDMIPAGTVPAGTLPSVTTPTGTLPSVVGGDADDGIMDNTNDLGDTNDGPLDNTPDSPLVRLHAMAGAAGEAAA